MNPHATLCSQCCYHPVLQMGKVRSRACHRTRTPHRALTTCHLVRSPSLASLEGEPRTPGSSSHSCRLAPHLSSPPQHPWDAESGAPYWGPIQGLPAPPTGSQGVPEPMRQRGWGDGHGESRETKGGQAGARGGGLAPPGRALLRRAGSPATGPRVSPPVAAG